MQRYIRMGRNNEQFRYHNAAGKAVLNDTSEETDPGVWIGNSLKPASYVTYAANKASQLLGLVKRRFHVHRW
jgi:hypothetical protein